MAINEAKIRQINARDMKRYERFGTRLFRKALIDQSKVGFDDKIMENAYIQFYQTVFIDSAKKEYNRIRKQEKRKDFVIDSFFLNTWSEWIRVWVVQNLGGLITNINNNTRTQITALLSVASEQGLNPFQTEKLIRDQIGGNKARALAISRTESTRANNMGKKRSAEDWANQTGEELYKVWVWGGSREPRESHVTMQGQPIRSSELFPIGGGMDKPGEATAPADETINCSCSVTYMSERFARENYKI